MTSRWLEEARVRWHLDARRELDQCLCLWVMPFGNPELAYRSYWCPSHRKKIEKSLR